MMWSDSNSFSEIQNTLAGIFESKMGVNVRVGDIIDLSYDEYQVIVNKIKIADTMETVNNFSLCLLVAWVSAYKFGTKDKDEFYRLMKEFISRLPQHQSRLALEELNSACYEYQIDTFGYNFRSVKDIKNFVKIHAGICEPEYV
ncbi:MAG: hypothetical protein II919_08225 [Lachnospiraceae bacterium]|nr:hypothetical protein [Lachnospiraceae bacterium]